MALFSLQELDIAEDPYILLIKNRVIEKVKDLFGDFERDINHQLSSFEHQLPEEINLKHGKISKGENYRHLPFVILDYPAFFTKEDIFAFRTMFYWGHFMSFTLHLQGKYANKYASSLIESFIKSDQGDKIYFCVNDTPWEYIYEEKNYKLLHTLSSSQIRDHLNANVFLKLSIKLSISEIHDSGTRMIHFFNSVLHFLNKQ